MTTHDSNCEYDAAFVMRHRRLQGFGGLGGGGFGGLGGGGASANSRCPMATFADRAQVVDAACAVGPGLGLPTQCSVGCALDFMPFWSECSELVTMFLGSELAEFEALSAECDGKDTRAILYMVDSLECDSTAFRATTFNRQGIIETYEPGNVPSLSACGDLCDDREGCEGFAYNSENACQLLNAGGGGVLPGEIASGITMSGHEGQVRIAGGGARGVLEINFGGQGWNAVCDDVFDSTPAAAIATCMTLGYATGTEYDTTHGSDEFAADNIQCPDTATNLNQCTMQDPYSDNCSDGETVGIDCQGLGSGVNWQGTPQQGEIYDVVDTVADTAGLYVMVDLRLNFDDAQEFCREHFYDLASVHTLSQEQTVSDLCDLSHFGTTGCHVGVHDDTRSDALIDLSGGTGGEAGELVYTVEGVAIVTSNNPVYNNGDLRKPPSPSTHPYEPGNCKLNGIAAASILTSGHQKYWKNMAMF
jgi:hypothetical protein